jgi:GrpB protein
MLMFRDWLRSNAADRDLYAHTKLALAKQEWKYVQNYADAKTAVIEEIIGRACLDGRFSLLPGVAKVANEGALAAGRTGNGALKALRWCDCCTPLREYDKQQIGKRDP